MENARWVISVIFFFHLCDQCSAGTWSHKADFPASSRNNAVSFSIANKGYYGLGQKQTDIFKYKVYTDLWEYDPEKDLWTQKSDFPAEGRLGVKGFALNRKGYAGFGYFIEAYGPNAGGNDYQSDFYEFIPDSNKWCKKNNNYLADRDICFFLNDTIWSLNVDYKLLKKYDPSSDSWNEYKLGKKPPSPYYSEIIGCDADFSLNGRECIITCMGKRKNLTNQLWEFDPYTRQWALKNNLPSSGNDTLIIFPVKQKVFALRGKNELFVYDAASDSWVEKKETTPQKYFTPVFSIGEKSYFISQHEFWEYEE